MKAYAHGAACCLLTTIALLQVSVIASCRPCRSPWTAFQDRCYLLVTYPKTSDEAEAHCRALSRSGKPSHLASIGSQEEHEFLVALIAASNGGSQNIWIGYHLDRASGSFYWIDGSQDGTYINWDSGEPNDMGGDEACTHINDHDLWNDAGCSNSYGFVCKRPTEM